MQGYYLPEAAHPYYTFAPTHTVDFASPKGANPPVDEYSVEVIFMAAISCITAVLNQC